jgi:hypothetical protein
VVEVQTGTAVARIPTPRIGAGADLLGEEAAVDALVAMWRGTLYGN